MEKEERKTDRKEERKKERKRRRQSEDGVQEKPVDAKREERER